MEKDCSFTALFVCLFRSVVRAASLLPFLAETAQDPNRDSAEPLNEPPEDMDAPDVKTGKSENTQMSDALAAEEPDRPFIDSSAIFICLGT